MLGSTYSLPEGYEYNSEQANSYLGGPLGSIIELIEVYQLLEWHWTKMIIVYLISLILH